MADRTCTVPGCEKIPRTKSADLCPMHYHRWYRHGTVHRNARETHISVSPGRRYRKCYMPGHPLSWSNGYLYEHRAVLYDAIGPGPHPCHWCGDPLDWLPKGQPGAIYVDHLNGYGDDNRTTNLVPSCNACNATRGMQARSDALREAGWWARRDTVALHHGRRPRIT